MVVAQTASGNHHGAAQAQERWLGQQNAPSHPAQSDELLFCYLQQISPFFDVHMLYTLQYLFYIHLSFILALFVNL